MPKFKRLEIWGDVQAAGGARLAMVPDVTVLTDDQKIGSATTGASINDSTLTATIPISSASYASLAERRILRVVYDDDTWDEWRIIKVEDNDEARGIYTTVTASGIAVDLARGVCKRTEADGSTWMDFEGLGLTPSQHITGYLLGALSDEGAAYWSLGTVDPTTPLDVVYGWDSPLAAINRIAQATGAEVQVTPVGTTGYAINLRTQIGGSATVPDVRLGKNIRAIKRLRDTTLQTTRLYGRGAPVDASTQAKPGIARAQWKVTNVAGNVVTLAEPLGFGPGPILEDNQLNNLYLRKTSGVLTLISASSVSAQTVTVASAAGISTGQLLELRRDAAGDDLVALDAPAERTAYGTMIGVLDRQDIPGTVNLVVNPAMRNWAGGAGTAPDNWTLLAGATLTKTTTAPFWRYAGQSCRVQTTNDGDGLETQYVTVSPTTPQPYFSGFVSFYLNSGQFRVEMVATNGTVTWVFPDGTSGKAYSNQTNTWNDIGVAGIDLNKLGANQVKMRVVQDGATASDAYVDAAQVVNWASQLPFFEGCGPTRLWQAVNAWLATQGLPLITVSVDIADLTRLQPAAWPYDAFTLGGTVNVTDAYLGGPWTVRCIELKRDLLKDADTSVVLSNRPQDLTDALVSVRYAARFPRQPGSPQIPQVDAYFDPVPAAPQTQVSVRLAARPTMATIFYVIQDDTAAPPVQGAAAFLTYATVFSVGRNQTHDQILYAYAALGNVVGPMVQWRISIQNSPTTTLSLAESPAGTGVASWIPDSTVAYVRVYEKKNGWPTTGGGAVTDPLDQTQFAGEFSPNPDGPGWDSLGNPVAGATSKSFAGFANTDTFRVILVPIDYNGNVMARVSAQLTMAGVIAPAIASVDTLVSHTGTTCGAPDNIDVGATGNAGVLNGDTLDVEMSLDGASYALQATLTFTAPSQHQSGNVKTFGFFGLPKADHNYYIRYKLRRAGVLKDTQTGGSVLFTQKTPLCP